MLVSESELSAAYNKYHAVFGCQRNDYFPLVYLSKMFKVSQDAVTANVAFGKSDYGFDAFYLDNRVLYLYQFKWSPDPKLFASSFERLTNAGMLRLFGNSSLADPQINQFIAQLRATLEDNKPNIEQVNLYFVFNGDAERAADSQLLTQKKDDLEEKQHLVHDYFGRHVEFLVRFQSNQTNLIVGKGALARSSRFEIPSETFALLATTQEGERLYGVQLSLADLLAMYRVMEKRLFERNVRYGLSAETAPNRSIQNAIKDVTVKRHGDPRAFIFRHNGVTLSVDQISPARDGKVELVEPRILNGAQTVVSLAHVIAKHEAEVDMDRLKQMRVLARLVVAPMDKKFVTEVTICNNRQNPINPLSLRACDDIQLRLQDHFRESLGMYYERQERAYSAYLEQEFDEMGIDAKRNPRAINIGRLAQTLLAAKGEIDRVSRIAEVCESQTQYDSIFNERLFEIEPRRIIIAYKVHLRLPLLLRNLTKQTHDSYFLSRGRNAILGLAIQGLLNKADIGAIVADHGSNTILLKSFSDELLGLANKLGVPMRKVAREYYATELEASRYSFLNTRTFYDRCMKELGPRYGWARRAL